MLIWTEPAKPVRRFLPSRCRPVYRCPGWLWLATWAFLWAASTVILRSLVR